MASWIVKNIINKTTWSYSTFFFPLYFCHFFTQCFFIINLQSKQT